MILGDPYATRQKIQKVPVQHPEHLHETVAGIYANTVTKNVKQSVKFLSVFFDY